MDYHDVIYGKMRIPEQIASIISTPQFQRLKQINQLGLLFLQFPEATYSRYDHSIGTYFRAAMMLTRLEQNTSWMTKIPDIYRNAVEIAALLHDIGHGPFSHTWEHIGWKVSHEENAFCCIDIILETCLPEFHKIIDLVKALIVGDKKSLKSPIPAEFAFLFEIVSNKRNGLDVDKWDYLKRDHYYLRHIVDPDMNFDDVFLQARASENGAHIEYRFQDYEKIYKLFDARAKFHIHCYRIPHIMVVEQILRDTIQNNNVQIQGKNIIDITSEDGLKYLDLTDDKILEALKDCHPFADILMGKIKLVPINPDIDDIKSSYFTVVDKVKYAGEEMRNVQFSFYGNAENASYFEHKMGFYEINSYFILKPS